MTSDDIRRLRDSLQHGLNVHHQDFTDSVLNLCDIAEGLVEPLEDAKQQAEMKAETMRKAFTCAVNSMTVNQMNELSTALEEQGISSELIKSLN